MTLGKIDSAIDTWVQSYDISARALSLYRILFAAYAVLFGLKRYAWVADYPAGVWRTTFAPFSFFDAYGTLSPGLYSAPMPEYVLLLLEGGLCLLFVLLLFGVWTPYVSVSTTILLILLNWQVYSLPKTNHDILFCITPLMMSLSGWGQFFSIDAQREAKGIAYPSVSSLLLALTITTGFAVAGLPKLIHWVDFDLATSGVRVWVTGIHFPEGGRGPLSGLVAYMTIPALWEMLDIAAVVFEVGFLLAVFRRRYFRAWVALAVGFHFGNYLMLGIPFFFNLPVYAAFLPWNRIARILRQDRLVSWARSWWYELGPFARGSGFLTVFAVAEILYFVRPAVGLHRSGSMQIVQVVVVFGVAFAAIGYFTFLGTAGIRSSNSD